VDGGQLNGGNPKNGGAQRGDAGTKNLLNRKDTFGRKIPQYLSHNWGELSERKGCRSGNKAQSSKKVKTKKKGKDDYPQTPREPRTHFRKGDPDFSKGGKGGGNFFTSKGLEDEENAPTYAEGKPYEPKKRRRPVYGFPRGERTIRKPTTTQGWAPKTGLTHRGVPRREKWPSPLTRGGVTERDKQTQAPLI